MRILLIIVLVYLILRILFRYILPSVLANFLRRKMEDFASHSQQFQNQRQTNKREGDVTINYTDNTQRSNKRDSGEYVDFEEIKD